MAMKDISDLQVCLAYQQSIDSQAGAFRAEWPDEILRQETSQPDKVILRCMERADRRGLIDYGVTLRSGWLTDRGKELIDSGLSSFRF